MMSRLDLIEKDIVSLKKRKWPSEKAGRISKQRHFTFEQPKRKSDTRNYRNEDF